MRIIDLQEGKFITKVNDFGWQPSHKLAIGLINGRLTYFQNGTPVGPVRLSSSAHAYEDFYNCDRYSNRITIRKPINFKTLM